MTVRSAPPPPSVGKKNMTLFNIIRPRLNLKHDDVVFLCLKLNRTLHTLSIVLNLCKLRITGTSGFDFGLEVVKTATTLAGTPIATLLSGISLSPLNLRQSPHLNQS